jgi:hypothetical protein
MEFLAAVSKRFPQYWVGGFVRYDVLDGAAFVDSPLVRTRGYFAAGVALPGYSGNPRNGERQGLNRAAPHTQYRSRAL